MQGDYVVLAAEPVCICGIDVAAPPQARAGRLQCAEVLFKAFQNQFTSNEVTQHSTCKHVADLLAQIEVEPALPAAAVANHKEGWG